MPFIIKRKIRNTTYVYEVTSYRDKRTGKPKNHQRCLGKLDADGVLISSKRRLPAEIKEIKIVKRKFIVKDIKN